MSALYLALWIAPSLAGSSFDLKVVANPSLPPDSETVQAEGPGLLYTEVFHLSERERMEFNIYLDEHLLGEGQEDYFSFSAQIYSVSVSRKGVERRRELISNPHLLTLEDQPARLEVGSANYAFSMEIIPHSGS